MLHNDYEDYLIIQKNTYDKMLDEGSILKMNRYD